jgi:hypothetical protein
MPKMFNDTSPEDNEVAPSPSKRKAKKMQMTNNSKINLTKKE